MMRQPVLKVTNIKKAYGAIQAVGLSLIHI